MVVIAWNGRRRRGVLAEWRRRVRYEDRRGRGDSLACGERSRAAADSARRAQLGVGVGGGGGSGLGRIIYDGVRGIPWPSAGPPPLERCHITIRTAAGCRSVSSRACRYRPTWPPVTLSTLTSPESVWFGWGRQRWFGGSANVSSDVRGRNGIPRHGTLLSSPAAARALTLLDAATTQEHRSDRR